MGTWQILFFKLLFIQEFMHKVAEPNFGESLFLVLVNTEAAFDHWFIYLMSIAVHIKQLIEESKQNIRTTLEQQHNVYISVI